MIMMASIFQVPLGETTGGHSLEKYVKNKKIYGCPSHSYKEPDGTQFSYGYNGGLGTIPIQVRVVQKTASLNGLRAIHSCFR